MKYGCVARSVRAFTLLELIVALLIVGIIGAAIFSTLRTAFRATASAEEAVEPLQRAAVALDFLSRDLQSALPPAGIPAGGAATQHLAQSLAQSFVETEGQDDAGGASDEVSFFAAVDAPAVKAA